MLCHNTQTKTNKYSNIRTPKSQKRIQIYYTVRPSKPSFSDFQNKLICRAPTAPVTPFFSFLLKWACLEMHFGSHFYDPKILNEERKKGTDSSSLLSSLFLLVCVINPGDSNSPKPFYGAQQYCCCSRLTHRCRELRFHDLLLLQNNVSLPAPDFRGPRLQIGLR